MSDSLGFALIRPATISAWGSQARASGNYAWFRSHMVHEIPIGPSGGMFKVFSDQ